MNTKQLGLLLLSLIFAGASFAGVYKWTDKKGVTHYTQYKPLEYPSVLVDAPPPPPADAPDLNKPYAQQIDQRGQSIRQQQTKSREQTSKSDFNAQQCSTAKKNLNALRAQGRVSYMNSAGEKIYMSDEEKISREAEAKKQIEFYCN